jgi:hypothetical protein
VVVVCNGIIECSMVNDIFTMSSYTLLWQFTWVTRVSKVLYNMVKFLSVSTEYSMFLLVSTENSMFLSVSTECGHFYQWLLRGDLSLVLPHLHMQCRIPS